MPATISSLELSHALFREFNVLPQLDDAHYYLVADESWLNNELAGALFDFLTLFDCANYVTESNDCDKFSGWAHAVARLLHSRTVRAARLAPGGLALGVLNYRPDWANGGAHSINWAALPCAVDDAHPEGIRFVTWEPQKTSTVILTDNEKNTPFKCTA